MKKMKKASGGAVGSHRADPRPMPLTERIKESRRRTAEAIGDVAPAAPKPPAKPKPEKYAMGGPVAAGIPAPQPRPSDYSIGPLRFGGMQEREVRPMRVPPRMQPNAPRPVGPGGGYKKGGQVDGCAMRGKTKGAKK